MAPRKVYPVPDLRKSYEATYGQQWISMLPRFNDSDRRHSFVNALTKRHHIRSIYNEEGYHTTWGDPNAIIAFAQSAAFFEDDDKADAEWVFDDLLGSGGFGVVGLWVRKDAKGFEIDKVAVKAAAVQFNDVLQFDPNGHRVPEEAVIQADLQKKSARSVLQLRKLKCIDGSQMRFYMEYCPFGDLTDMITLYRDRNTRHKDAEEQIPEAFLWQLLLRFAELMLKMQEEPFDHPRAATLGKDPFILHLDIKPENVFVGDLEDEDIVKEYPACKVGDWGLAKLTSLTDKDNSYEFKYSGTRRWMPPEQFNGGRFGDGWHNPPPPWRDEYLPNNHAYTSGHTVFQFGEVLYALMTLDYDNRRIHSDIEQADRMENMVKAARYKWYKADDLRKNLFDHTLHYSAILRTVVADCLNFDPAQRPNIMDLYDAAIDQCKFHAARQDKPEYAGKPEYATLRYGKADRGNFFAGTSSS